MHFPVNTSTFVVCPTQLCCCLNHKNISASESVCFAPRASFCFAIENESAWFNCFPCSHHCTDCRRGGFKFLRDVYSLPFWISVCCCEISNSLFINSGSSFLPATTPYVTTWQSHRTPKMSGMVPSRKEEQGWSEKKLCYLTTCWNDGCQLLL